jgi:hypothetical protein
MGHTARELPHGKESRYTICTATIFAFAHDSSAVVFGYGAGASLSLTLSWGIALPGGNAQSQWRIADLAWDYIDQEPGYTRANVEEMLTNKAEQCDKCGQ